MTGGRGGEAERRADDADRAAPRGQPDAAEAIGGFGRVRDRASMRTATLGSAAGRGVAIERSIGRARPVGRIDAAIVLAVAA